MASRGSTKPLTPRPNSKANVSAGGRQTIKKPGSAKASGKPNASILSFFKKVDSPVKDDSIFISQGSQYNDVSPSKPSADDFEVGLEDLYGDDKSIDFGRFNEATGAVKRRKTSNESTPTPGKDIEEDTTMGDNVGNSLLPAKSDCTPPPETVESSKSKAKKPKQRGPFISDSESDDEALNQIIQEFAVAVEEKALADAVVDQTLDMNHIVSTRPVRQKRIQENKPVVPKVEAVIPVTKRPVEKRNKINVAAAQAKWEALQPKVPEPPEEIFPDAGESDGSSYGGSKPKKKKKARAKPKVPALKKESTSVDEWVKFDDLEEFPDDDFEEGEEFVEKKWMEEQARIEAAELEDAEEFNGFDEDPVRDQGSAEIVAACPICEASLNGLSSDDASRHVNGCLDGNPIPLPVPAPASVKKEPGEVKEPKLMPPEANNRFARKAAVARPGQANPFQLGDPTEKSSSAFSKLMSGHAEDAAWANAAAAEQKSRGKPAYERTCPFYKIMPGFFICVDAFRYGAVQGCNAYFLSHFHSDHYIGLTSSWCHGPIYCSKVTGNLVKQQLRVDPKWVVSLEFDERFEVPGTQGVAVTMIPANHCPGSSLFLYEKVVGKGANPKIQRILHCGDFRACPAHVAHPLLMPNLVCSITGKTKQQKIDVCYLDTTYLNPRYSFPSQEEVISACADMCVSLKKERAEESDAWERVKRERAGTGMTKFVNSAIKAEDDSIAMSLASNGAKPRGRLLVVCGTYSIGKERICLGIARALDCKIFAPPGKMRICKALEDEELMSRMTDDPREAQIHMQMLMEIRPETLQEYLNFYKPHFSRIVGFRPSGWNYKPPNSRFTESPSVPTILHSVNWRSSFSMAELVPQRGSTKEASCFGVPYSEHSSFRELTMFICALRVEKVVPTVNVGSAAGRAKMKTWIERWMAERRKNGVLKLGQSDGEVKW